MPQFEPYGMSRPKDDIKILGIPIIIIFTIFALNVVRLWISFLPRMEEAGRETERLISGSGGGAAVQIINTEIIPELRIFLILTLISFGFLDGVFSFMLWKGDPNQEHRMLIMPLYTIYILGRILSGIIIITIASIVIVGSDPRGLMNILYMTTLVFSALSILIIILFQKKIFTTRKRTATKILMGRSEKSIP